MKIIKVSIKEAGIDNLEELMQWRMLVLKTVFKLPNNFNMSELYNQNKEYYLKTIPEGSHIAAFALLNQKIVGCGGMCLYQEMPSPDNQNGKCAYLMNIYTPVEYQNHGIATQIVSWLIKKAQEKHVNKIYLESTKKAFNLYKHLGFKDLKDYLILGE